MKMLALFLLRGYQLILSPWMKPNCRFYPSCSQYAIQAITQYGIFKGAYLTGRRLCKCHPWHPGGVDLVPTIPAPTLFDHHHSNSPKP